MCASRPQRDRKAGPAPGICHLLAQDVDCNEIVLLTGERGDSIDDLYAYLTEHPEIKYIFVDYAEGFSHILRAGDYLLRLTKKKKLRVILNCDSPPAQHLLCNRTLRDNCEIITSLNTSILNELVNSIEVGPIRTVDGVRHRSIKIEYRQFCYVEIFSLDEMFGAWDENSKDVWRQIDEKLATQEVAV